jgi:serine protease Do
VVEGADEVRVRLTDRREFKGKVVGIDKLTDVAVVKIDAKGLQAVKIGDPARIRVGEWVLAIGSPFGFENTVSAGIVSAKGRSLPQENFVPFLQTDVAINPGNSGGPLVDRLGRLVGINTAGVRLAEAENVSFAIAIDEALPVIERIRNQIPETQTWLGVSYNSVDTDAAAVQLGLDASVRGAAVTVVYPGGPGEDADLAVGDVITVADDVPINSAADLAKLLAKRKPGDELDLELIDSRGPRLVTVRLEKRT